MFTTQIVSELTIHYKIQNGWGTQKLYMGCIETRTKKKKKTAPVFKSGCGSAEGALTLDTRRLGSIPTNVIFFSPDFFTQNRY